MSIYQSTEMDAWSRGFDYKNYRAMHQGMAEGGAPISREGYEALCKLLDAEMERSFNGTGDFRDPNYQG